MGSLRQLGEGATGGTTRRGPRFMKNIKRGIAVAAAMLLATGGMLVVGISPAQAAPQLSFTPTGPFKGGETVTVTFSGYAAGAPVAIGVCPQGRNVTGPGDCAPSKTGASRLVTADASGKGTGKIKIPIGPLKNIKAPAESCGPAKADGCTMGASAIDGSGQAPVILIKYATAAATPSASATATATAEPTDEATPEPTASTDDDNLADTGPSSTGWMALLGLGVLQIGLIAAVRAARAGPGRHLA
jgi:hypothetical protein